MRNRNKLFVLSCVACVAVGLAGLAGCATPEVTPGTPFQPAVTNAATGVITPAVPATPPTTNYVVPVAVTTATGVAGAAAPFIPPPWDAIVALAATAVASGFGLYAKAKNTQAQTHQAAAASMAATLTQIAQSPTPVAPSAVHALTMQNAATNGSTGAVAEHMASAASPT